MLSLLLIIPIIGSIALLLITDDPSGVRSKKVAIATSLLNLIISIYLWVQFDSSTSQYQFVYSFKELSYCHLNIGVDGLSIYFVLLTTFLTPVALLSNYNTINNNLKYFLISFLILETLQIALFVVLDLLLFYVFFESILPILFIVIILYGSGANKERSAFLFFLYTLAGSLFMLLAILEISNYVGSTDFQLISLSEINIDSQKFLWLAFFLAFAIKTPLWPMTGWLYRAHADSPLAGSILLAGTILKMATYGYLRVLINFLPDATHYFSPLVQTIALITIVYASLATIVQQDTKQLIAYSSICHMGVVVLGLFSNTIQGIEGAILLSIAHGFVSPALFICVGGVIYDRTGVRLIPYIRGLVLYMPLFTIFFFIFTLFNTGIPLSLNFLGEQLSLIGTWERNPLAAVIGATGIVFSAIYSIWLYNRLSYGSYSPYLKPLRDITRREFVLLISLLIPTVVLGVYPNVILETLHASITTLLYNLPLTPFYKVFTVIYIAIGWAMIFISLLIIIMATAIPSIKTHLSPVLITRIISIILFYSGALAFNAFYIQSIGSGIGVYSELFHVTTISQQLDIFIFSLGGLILLLLSKNNIMILTNYLKRVYNTFWVTYFKILSLPMIYRAKNIKTLLAILLIVLLSYIFNIVFTYQIESKYINLNYLLCGVILNIFLLKFNLIIRFVNVFFKTTLHLTKNKLQNKFSSNTIVCYYIFNIICFIVLIPLVIKLEFNLFKYNESLGEITQIYTCLFAVIFALMYLSHTFSDEIISRNERINTISKYLSIFFIFTISYSLFISITNYFNPILCEPTGNENRQIDQNTQTNNSPTNSNEQTNINNQSSSSSKSSSPSNPKSNSSLSLINQQGKITIQIINSSQKYTYINGVSENEPEFKLISDYKNHQEYIAKEGREFINNFTNHPSHDILLNNLLSIEPEFGVYTNLDYYSNPVLTLLHNKVDFEPIKVLNPNFDVRLHSFSDIFCSLKSLQNTGIITNETYTSLVINLINYTMYYDSDNNFLENFKNILVDTSNFLNITCLKDKFIFLHNHYSILIKDPIAPVYNFISIKSNNVYELYNNNKHIIKRELVEDIKKYNTYFGFKSRFNFVLSNDNYGNTLLSKYRTHGKLQELMFKSFLSVSKHQNTISIIPRYSVFYNNLGYTILNKYNEFDLTQIQKVKINGHVVYIYKNILEDGTTEYFVFDDKNKNQLMATIYQEHRKYIKANTDVFFYDPTKKKHIEVFYTNDSDKVILNTNNHLINYYDNQNSEFKNFKIKNTITYDQQNKITNKIDTNKKK